MKVKKVTGYGYVGFWDDGRLGWFLPRHLSGYVDQREPIQTWPEWSNEGEPVQLCRITLEPLPMKRQKFVPFEDRGVYEQRRAIRLGLVNQ